MARSRRAQPTPKSSALLSPTQSFPVRPSTFPSSRPSPNVLFDVNGVTRAARPAGAGSRPRRWRWRRQARLRARGGDALAVIVMRRFASEPYGSCHNRVWFVSHTVGGRSLDHHCGACSGSGGPIGPGPEPEPKLEPNQPGDDRRARPSTPACPMRRRRRRRSSPATPSEHIQPAPAPEPLWFCAREDGTRAQRCVALAVFPTVRSPARAATRTASSMVRGRATCRAAASSRPAATSRARRTARGSSCPPPGGG